MVDSEFLVIIASVSNLQNCVGLVLGEADIGCRGDLGPSILVDVKQRLEQ